MNSQWVTFAVCMLIAFASIVSALRHLLRRPLTSADFRKHFTSAWASVGMLAGGTIWLVLTAPVGLNHEVFILAISVGGLALAFFMLTSYPVGWIASRWYERSQTHADFAEDASGNPTPAMTPADET